MTAFLEKVKAWYAAVRDFLIYIVTPLAFLFGYIAHLWAKQKALEDKVTELDQAVIQRQEEQKVKEDEVQSNQSSADFEQLANEYLREHPGGSDVSAGNRGVQESASGQGQNGTGSEARASGQGQDGK